MGAAKPPLAVGRLAPAAKAAEALRKHFATILPSIVLQDWRVACACIFQRKRSDRCHVQHSPNEERLRLDAHHRTRGQHGIDDIQDILSENEDVDFQSGTQQQKPACNVCELIARAGDSHHLQ